MGQDLSMAKSLFVQPFYRSSFFMVQHYFSLISTLCSFTHIHSGNVTDSFTPGRIVVFRSLLFFARFLSLFRSYEPKHTSSTHDCHATHFRRDYHDDENHNIIMHDEQYGKQHICLDKFRIANINDTEINEICVTATAKRELRLDTSLSLEVRFGYLASLSFSVCQSTRLRHSIANGLERLWRRHSDSMHYRHGNKIDPYSSLAR